MPYNNYYPVTYPQMSYQQAPYQQPMIQQPNPNSIVWVQGESGAKAYPVQSGTSQLLMDSEAECFYIKSADASGMPLPLRMFAYKEVINTSPEKSETSFNPKDYVTKEDFESLKKQIEGLKMRKDKGNE